MFREALRIVDRHDVLQRIRTGAVGGSAILAVLPAAKSPPAWSEIRIARQGRGFMAFSSAAYGGAMPR